LKNLIIVLLGGLSGEKKISFLTGRACSQSLKKLGYKVKELDPQGSFVEKIKNNDPN
jgi:D-alanine-D-alanine ligase-like ATP-grasp enzyme